MYTMEKGAIFDMDGLLFDTELVYNQAWHEVAKQHKLSIHPEMLDAIRGTNGVFMQQIVNSYWPEVNAEKLIDEVFENSRNILTQSVPMKPGVHELLDYMKSKNLVLALASSAPLDLIYSNLKIANIFSYFDVVVSGEQVVRGKPAPDIFLLAAEKLSLNPENCYVLEDGLHGVHAGIQAGCATIMVPDLIAPTEELYEKCVGIYHNLYEVLEAMKKSEC